MFVVHWKQNNITGHIYNFHCSISLITITTSAQKPQHNFIMCMYYKYILVVLLLRYI